MYIYLHDPYNYEDSVNISILDMFMSMWAEITYFRTFIFFDFEVAM